MSWNFEFFKSELYQSDNVTNIYTCFFHLKLLYVILRIWIFQNWNIIHLPNVQSFKYSSHLKSCIPAWKLRADNVLKTILQIAPPTKNDHAPPPTESRKSSQSVNPQSVNQHYSGVRPALNFLFSQSKRTGYRKHPVKGINDQPVD